LEVFPCRRFKHKGGTIYAYAWVSTDGRTVAAKVAAMTATGPGKVFRKVASGAKAAPMQWETSQPNVPHKAKKLLV
jgi:hypothetical protein